jgi:hypothetical protein
MFRSRILLTVIVLPLFVSACGEPVRQDRSIRVSHDGRTAAFLGDGNAVFVKELETGELEKIFDAPPGTLAVSSPRWNATGDKLIFCTATAADGSKGDANVSTPADGLRYAKRPVHYVCWLFEKGARPVEIFQADCNHVGYIGGDLAVRWSADGAGIEFVSAVDCAAQSLFRYDLKEQSTRRIFAAQAEGLIFGHSPDGNRLYCLLGADVGPTAADGLWIQDADQWWHVPASNVEHQGAGSILEELRRAEPVWTNDSRRLAFVSCQPSEKEGVPATYSLKTIDLNTRKVELCCTSTQRLHHVHWRPDQAKLGLLVDGAKTQLHVVAPGERLERPLFADEIREFAGWNVSGTQMAFVAAEPLPGNAGDELAFLFLRNAAARSSIRVAGRDGENPRTLTSGLRSTYLNWAPAGDKLSVWLTFEPTYRSWASLEGLGLRAGDPAAIIDATTGKLDWMPTRGFEKIQLGHFHLLRKEYGEAEEWYRRAEAELSDDEKNGLLPFQMILALSQGRGVNPDTARLAERFFAKSPVLVPTQAGPLSTRPATAAEAQKQANSFSTRFARFAHVAEAFLSVDDLDGGRQWFANVDRDGDDRLCARLLETQFLLMRGEWHKYLECLHKKVLPAWAESSPAADPIERAFRTQAVTLAVLPFGSDEFLARLPKAMLLEWKVSLLQLRDKAIHDDAKRLIDMMLLRIARQLQDQKLQASVEQRLPKNMAGADLWQLDLPGLFHELKLTRGLLNAGWW